MIGLSPQIDNWGHLGGLIGGALFAWFAGPVMEVAADSYSLSPAVVDTRREMSFVSTALWVAAIFAILALITIVTRIGIF